MGNQRWIKVKFLTFRYTGWKMNFPFSKKLENPYFPKNLDRKMNFPTVFRKMAFPIFQLTGESVFPEKFGQKDGLSYFFFRKMAFPIFQFRISGNVKFQNMERWLFTQCNSILSKRCYRRIGLAVQTFFTGLLWCNYVRKFYTFRKVWKK